MKKLVAILTVATLMALPAAAIADPGLWISDCIGDNDGYGYGAGVVADGADLPFTDDPTTGAGWFFDNRSAAELAATDGAQETDVEPAALRDAMFYHHSFDLSVFSVVTSAVYTIDVSGIQTADLGLSRLYFDGTEVAGAFAGVEQGPWGSDVFSFAVNLADIADGMLDVRFVGGSADAIAIDYSCLDIQGQPIPEPATLFLLGSGLVGAAVARRRRKNA